MRATTVHRLVQPLVRSGDVVNGEIKIRYRLHRD